MIKPSLFLSKNFDEMISCIQPYNLSSRFTEKQIQPYYLLAEGKQANKVVLQS